MWDWRNYVSFEGRLNRKPFWLMSLALFGAGLAGFVVVCLLAVASTFFWLLAIPLVATVVLASMSLSARRLHDRNKSAWWLLLYQGVPTLLDGLRAMAALADKSGDGGGLSALLGLISFCLSLWVLVDLGFRRGSPGPNRFGEDPLRAEVGVQFA